jgi:acetyltransferase-like isoleucine patch superfamily enzyme
MKPANTAQTVSRGREFTTQDTQSNRSAVGSRRQSRFPMAKHWCIAPDVRLGDNVKLARFIHLFGCEVGDNTKIGAFVEIQKSTTIGKNCKISSHTFICEGVTIQDNVSVGHGVTFIKDAYPHAATPDGQLQAKRDWKVEPTVVEQGASIGSGATILSNVTIGANAVVGAGSVVTRNVPPKAIVAGNPAKAVQGFDPEPVSVPAKVLFDDLIAPHLELQEELLSALTAALTEITHGRIIQLKKVTRKAARQLEGRIIARVLEANGWNRRSTARALSISYGALLQKMKEADLVPKRPRRFGETVPAPNWRAADTEKAAPQDADQLDSVPYRQ